MHTLINDPSTDFKAEEIQQLIEAFTSLERSEGDNITRVETRTCCMHVIFFETNNKCGSGTRADTREII